MLALVEGWDSEGLGSATDAHSTALSPSEKEGSHCSPHTEGSCGLCRALCAWRAWVCSWTPGLVSAGGGSKIGAMVGSLRRGAFPLRDGEGDRGEISQRLQEVGDGSPAPGWPLLEGLVKGPQDTSLNENRAK